MSKEPEEELNDPGNEDPGSLMDEAEVPLMAPVCPVEPDPHPK
ncbi:hypothetical protein [Pseudomonas syringae]|nr:hypothetical protein [Pseudomonas syringae]